MVNFLLFTLDVELTYNHPLTFKNPQVTTNKLCFDKLVSVSNTIRGPVAVRVSGTFRGPKYLLAYCCLLYLMFYRIINNVGRGK